MKSAMLAVLCCLLAAPARADETAKTANALLGAQIADAVTTRVLLQRPRTFERDPIVKPFVKTDLGAAAVVVATNLIARSVFKHSPQTLRWLAGAECVASASNLRVTLRASRQLR